MATSCRYFVRKNGSEVGPLSTAQINRMFQRGDLEPEMPCRVEHGTELRRLDDVLPHLTRNKRANPEKVQAIKREIDGSEARWLTRTGIVSALFFWTPMGLGVVASGTAIGCGLTLLIRYRKPIGLLPLFMGIWGLSARFSYRFSH